MAAADSAYLPLLTTGPTSSPAPWPVCQDEGGWGASCLEICYFFKRNPRVRTAARVSRADAGQSERRQRGLKGAGRWTDPRRRCTHPGTASGYPCSSRPRRALNPRAIPLRRCPAEGGASTPRGTAHVGSSSGSFSPPFQSRGAGPSLPPRPRAPSGFCPVSPPLLFLSGSLASPGSAGVTVCGDRRVRTAPERFGKELRISGGTGQPARDSASPPAAPPPLSTP